MSYEEDPDFEHDVDTLAAILRVLIICVIVYTWVGIAWVVLR